MIDEVWICASPKAGSGAGREEIDLLASRLRADSRRCQITHSLKELTTRLADPACPKEHFAVVAAGGDGTIGLLAQHTAHDIPIVPMPMGTENLLARHWGFSAQAASVAATIAKAERFSIDAGLANGRLFLVMVTAGMDAEVVRGMHLTRRGHINRWSYTRPILRALAKYPYPIITSTSIPTHPEQPCDAPRTGLQNSSEDRDETPISACWMMAFNLPQYAGGLSIEPDAIADDGLLDLVAMRKGYLWSGLNYLANIKLGSHLSHADVTRRKVRRMVWTALTRVPYQIDGDYAGRLPVHIEVLPNRVTLLRPETSR